MEYFLEKLRMSRSVKDDQISIESKQAKNDRRPTKIFHSQLQYPSPTFIDKVLLSRSLKVKRTEGEGIAEFSNSEFVQQCLRTHNELRLRHEVPPLQLCYKLCDLAQYWANHLAHTDDFYYRKFRDVGENLLCRWSYVPDFDITGEQVARYWYSEIKYYDFFLDPSILHVQAGHFSQMVWRSSSDFGVGKARTRCGKIIVVAMYKPAGNVLGEFQSNVLPHPLPADSASPQASASSSST
uniref:Putative scp-like extracellular protein n=1 Tax=Ixodes ricinus TaxID=34613 RepID=A0A131XVI7_IXORI